MADRRVVETMLKRVQETIDSGDNDACQDAARAIFVATGGSKNTNLVLITSGAHDQLITLLRRPGPEAKYGVAAFCNLLQGPLSFALECELRAVELENDVGCLSNRRQISGVLGRTGAGKGVSLQLEVSRHFLTGALPSNLSKFFK